MDWRSNKYVLIYIEKNSRQRLPGSLGVKKPTEFLQLINTVGLAAALNKSHLKVFGKQRTESLKLERCDIFAQKKIMLWGKKNMHFTFKRMSK